MSKDRKIVLKVEDDADPSQIYCTTYQMRNFFHQFADGFFSSLDVMNYIQHHKAVTMMEPGDRVLDVCCGRGLLLPLIRYYARDIKEYVGVDISEANISEQKRISGVKRIERVEGDKRPLDQTYPGYYPFKISHVIASVEDMDQYLEPESFDFIIYTSAIEHMQKEVGQKSLENCFKLMKPSAEIFLSCPNTMNKKDPYDTQYAAHLYEWDLQELSAELLRIGFNIYETHDKINKKREFDIFMQSRPESEQQMYARFKEYLPTNWLMSLFPILYPEAAAEVLIIAGKRKPGLSGFNFK